MSILSGSRGSCKISDRRDGLGCYHFCYHMAGAWKRNNSKNYAAGSAQERNTSLHFDRDINRRQARKIADTYETAARTKRTLLQTQKVIQRLHEEMNGEIIARVTTRSRIVDWLATNKTKIASTSLAFNQTASASSWSS